MIPVDPWTSMLHEMVGWLPKLGASCAVFIGFWIGGMVAAKLIDRLGRSRRLDADLTLFLRQSSKISLLVFGAISALGTLGVNVSAVVAGLGLTGLALGLALKEVVSNAVAGVMLILYKPFNRGDVVKVLDFQGRALEVNLRYTLLETSDGRVYVPNMMLVTNVVLVGAADLGANQVS